MSDSIPPYFSRYQLAELAAPGSDTFVDGPFGSSLKSDEYVDAGVRLIQLQNIGEGEWRDQNKKFITHQKFKALERHGAIPGDIAIAKMAEPVARACLVPPVSDQLVVVADCIRLRLDETRFDPGFVVRAINSPYTRREAEKLAIGSTRVRINLSVLKTVGCIAPELAEQQGISRILDTLDTFIARTEAIIAKLKTIKQGLLHDLLTRGIDDNGELRPPQIEAPQLYKQSALGWIPKEWDVHIFGDLIDHVIDFRGRTPKKLGMEWGEGDILALSANNVQPGGIDTSREANFGSEELYRKWMTNGPVSKGDVLLTMEAPLGNVAQIPDDAKYILSQRVVALRFDKRTVLNDFAFWQMQSREFQKAMISKSTGSTATGIQRAELVKLPFRTPSTPEQDLIAKRLLAVEHRLSSELKALEKCRQEKIGLLDDLLTGNVRVAALIG